MSANPTVDLRAVPYHLDDSQVAWVEDTLAGLTQEEKVGQVFVNLFHFGVDTFSGGNLTSEEILAKYHIGGARYHGGTAEQVQTLINSLQAASKVPLLVATNCESGGNGACTTGTYMATGAQCGASGGEEVPFRTGVVSGRESSAVGVNVNFAPIVDILFNWRNTIVNTRCHGDNADDVIRSTDAKARGLREAGDVAVAIKHWPGDGTEERDQHLVLGVNELTPAEWEESFGKVYRHHIGAGVEMIMAGHIALPEYSKVLDPSLTDADIMPATLAPELLQDLLKTRLGFNGIVITDASHMLGMTSAMRRQDYVPRAIAAGCDMFLFFNDMDEDFNFMLEGTRNGVITPERLDDAVRRILGLKAKLNLHVKQAEGTLLKPASALEVVGCEEHLRWRDEAADASITLVKDTQNNLPLSPEKHRRVKLYYLDYAGGGGIYASDDSTLKNFIAELEGRGFEVTVNDGDSRVKGSTLTYRDEVDAAIVVANIVGYASENNYRIRWKTPMSTDCPWYVHEVPTVMVSLNFTTHLHDATMVKTYINAYSDNPATIRQVVDKITGVSEFRGRYNDTVWAGKWQAKL